MAGSEGAEGAAIPAHRLLLFLPLFLPLFLWYYSVCLHLICQRLCVPTTAFWREAQPRGSCLLHLLKASVVAVAVEEMEQYLDYIGGPAGALALTGAAAASAYYLASRPTPRAPLVPLDTQSVELPVSVCVCGGASDGPLPSAGRARVSRTCSTA